MRITLSAAALLCMVHPVFAGGCGDGEQALMGCAIADAKGNYDGTALMLCARPPDTGDVWKGLHYVFDRKGVREFSYPENPDDGKDHFFTHHLYHQGLYRFRVRFESEGFAYELYIEENPAPAEPDEVQSVDAGVRVYKGGKLVDGRICGESPNPFYGYIRRSTACDLKTPYGKRVCEDNAPELK